MRRLAARRSPPAITPLATAPIFYTWVVLVENHSPGVENDAIVQPGGRKRRDDAAQQRRRRL
ncbi:hypothetical protein [Mycolicibacterium porcinum]|uniref:hypothetical protein n=1 Tax=Mycolicibacterium porcinum TaxID=39693 RepID=UPI0010424C8F|nr:hypothetical protein [Mycolicibacterium porcinum]